MADDCKHENVKFEGQFVECSKMRCGRSRASYDPADARRYGYADRSKEADPFGDILV